MEQSIFSAFLQSEIEKCATKLDSIFREVRQNPMYKLAHYYKEIYRMDFFIKSYGYAIDSEISADSFRELMIYKKSKWEPKTGSNLLSYENTLEFYCYRDIVTVVENFIHSQKDSLQVN